MNSLCLECNTHQYSTGLAGQACLGNIEPIAHRSWKNTYMFFIDQLIFPHRSINIL